jgi:hypothetical protein
LGMRALCAIEPLQIAAWNLEGAVRELLFHQWPDRFR